MKRITHVITGLNRGGAETVLYRLTTGLTNFQHTVISLNGDGEIGQDLRHAGITVLTPQLWQLPWVLRRTKPDLIQTWMYHSDLLGGLLGRTMTSAPVLWNIRNSTLSQEHTKKTTHQVVRLCAKLSKYIPRQIVTCSETAKDVHAALGYVAEKFHVIPNGIDTTRFTPDSFKKHQARTAWQFPEGPIVGMVARFDPQKDHALLIGVLERMPNVNLVLIGPDTQKIPLPDSLQHRVRLMGTRQDVDHWLPGLDLFVLSSAYGEGFPNALAEAMSCDIPCVATDVGDVRQIIGDTGCVVPPQSPEAFEKACHHLLTHQMASPRARILELFSLEAMIGAYRHLYEREITSCAASQAF